MGAVSMVYQAKEEFMKKNIIGLIALVLTLSLCFSAMPGKVEAADDAIGISWMEGTLRKYQTISLDTFKKYLNEGISAASGSSYISVCLLKNIETEKFAIPNYHGTYQIDLDTYTWKVTGADSITAASININGGPVHGSRNIGSGKLCFTNQNMGTLFTIKGADKTSDSGVYIEDAIIEFENNAKCERFFNIEELVAVNSSTRLYANNAAFLNVKATAENGGVFYINYDDECLNKMEFIDCVFSNCSSAYRGGAIYIETIPGKENSHTLLNLSGSSFNYCHTGEYGGAIYINPYYLDINTDASKDTMFFKCSADHSGGAIFDDAGYGTFKHMFFSNNSAGSTSYGGGAMYICDAKPAGYRTVENCVFYKNSAKGYGGALYDDAPYYDTLRNCRFEFNSADKGGNEICYPSKTIENCEFYRSDFDTTGDSDFYSDYKPTGNFIKISSDYAYGLFTQKDTGINRYEISDANDVRTIAMIAAAGQCDLPVDLISDIKDVYYQIGDMRYDTDGKGHTITSVFTEPTFTGGNHSITQKTILDIVKPSAPTGSAVSTGNWWIIGGAIAAAIAAVVAVVVVKRKKKKAT